METGKKGSEMPVETREKISKLVLELVKSEPDGIRVSDLYASELLRQFNPADVGEVVDDVWGDYKIELVGVADRFRAR